MIQILPRPKRKGANYKEELASLTSVSFDQDLYGAGNRFEGYERSIPVNEEEDEQDATEREVARKLASYTAPKSILSDLPRGEAADDDFGFKKAQKMIQRKKNRRGMLEMLPTHRDAKTQSPQQHHPNHHN